MLIFVLQVIYFVWKASVLILALLMKACANSGIESRPEYIYILMWYFGHKYWPHGMTGLGKRLLGVIYSTVNVKTLRMVPFMCTRLCQPQDVYHLRLFIYILFEVTRSWHFIMHSSQSGGESYRKFGKWNCFSNFEKKLLDTFYLDFRMNLRNQQ